jgi:NADPH2:quinone reductase
VRRGWSEPNWLINSAASTAQRERQRAILEQTAPFFESSDLRVVVGVTFPLEQAADAHRVLEAGEVVGKAVLTMD